MLDSYANLRTQLNLLAESFHNLGASLAENARGLREEMVPPDEMLAEKISEARREFTSFREAVLASAKATIAPDAHSNGQVSSLRGLEELIGQIEKHCVEIKELRRRAIDLLDDILNLRYRGAGTLPELRDCQQRALAVRDHLLSSQSVELLPELNAVANRDTAFADLLDLVNPMDEMDSEIATSLSIKVEGAFGRRLVVEALRGQIVLPNRNDPTNDPESPPPDSAPVTPTLKDNFAQPAKTDGLADPGPAQAARSEPTTGQMATTVGPSSPTKALEEAPPPTKALDEPLPPTKAFDEPPPPTKAFDEPPPPTKAFDEIAFQSTMIEETSFKAVRTEELIPRVTGQSAISEGNLAETITIEDAAVTTRLVEENKTLEEPQSEQNESDSEILFDELFQPPPSEIASELASDLATLASTLASDLMLPSVEPAPPAFVDVRVTEVIPVEAEHKMNAAELVAATTGAPGAIRVTEDLTINAPVSFGTSAREMVLSLLKPDGISQPEAFYSLLWQMVAEDRLGLAFHLSQAIERVYPDIPNRLPSHFIHALALSRAVCYDAGEIASALMIDLSRYDENFFAQIENDPDQDWSYAIHLLLVAIVLRPALLAPSTQAESVLASIRLGTGLDNLASYCRGVFDFAIYKQPFDYLSLGRSRTTEEWQNEVNDLVQRVKEWHGQASQFDLKDGMAKKVWISWLMNQGKISSLLQPILQNDIQRLAMVKSDIEALSNDLEIESEINKTNREIRGWDAPDINSHALEQICKYTREAISFGQSWVSLEQSYLRQLREDPINRNRDLRETILELRDRVFEDIERLRRTQRTFYLNCAAQLCLRTVSDIDRLLSGSEEPAAELSVREIINADLLRIPDIPMNRRWEAEGVTDVQIIRGVLEAIADTRFDWKKAFDLRKQYEDHEATLRIIELLSVHRNHSVRLDELIIERDLHLDQCRITLQSSLDTLREKIEAGVIAEWLDHNQRADYIARIEQIEQQAPTGLRFFELNERLKNLNLALETHCVRMRVENEGRRNREVEILRQKVESVRFNLKEDDYRRIMETLDDGDTQLADHYQRIALRGDDLPIRYDEAYHLKAFFPASLRNIITLSNSILTGGSLVDDARNMLGGEFLADQVYRAISAWESAKRTNRLNEEGLREILDFLGFYLHAVEPYRTKSPGDLLLTLSLKNESVQLPAPRYGSEALNRYRLFCLFDGPSPEELTRLIPNSPDNPPTIYFYFGSLIEEQRRKLARLCNEKRLVFVVLDDLLLLHLCKISEPRIEAFFHCSLPFSFSNPYNPDRPVAQELFFGRTHELNQLLDMKGTSFVYGGRRIGKTSLLLEAKRRFDKRGGRGDWEQLAIYLDLNSENIGSVRPLDYIWKKLSDLFIEALAPAENSWNNIGASLILSQVRKWLDGDPHRKILFLLDDADTFLRLDGNDGFIRCNRLKSLMDEPGYRQRFKVIFAGNNQVLRATEVENHPLAHMGDPISIGPFLRDREDVYAAIRLIEKVFASVGYEFEKPELILRILSLTDYYPNLIQLFCQHLIKFVTGSTTPVFEMEKSPPYILTSKHIQDAYQRPEFTKRLADSFLWTLELERRYLAIAQIIAYHNGEFPNGGFDISWIRRQVLMWWPECFRDCQSLFDIRTVLEEMEELCLIRRIGDRYGLRSPRLVSLFGAQDELEIALHHGDKLTPSPQFEALSFRLPFSSQVSRRSPLTMGQFHQLRIRESGVSIIFGCKASDLDSIDLFLAHMLPHEFVCMNKYASRSDFARTIAELRQKTQVSVLILFVPADCSWDEEWMAEALRNIGNLASKDRFTRIVFAADPVKTWRWLNLDEGRRAELNLKQVTSLFSLTPWHDCFLRLWLDDLGIRATDDQRAQITQVTGNWPTMLDKFYKMASIDTREWESSLNALDASFGDCREDLELAMGLHLTEPGVLLRELAKWGKASADDLVAASGTRLEIVERSLRWADLLGLISPSISRESEKIHWKPTPLVQRLLNL